MMIKIIANFLCNGEKKEIVEESNILISDPPLRKDTSDISNMLKKLFENQLNRTVVVKTRIKENSVISTINIRPNLEDQNPIETDKHAVFFNPIQ